MIAEKLLAAVDGAKGRPLAARQLAAAAGLNPGEFTNAKRVLRELVREGVLQTQGKRFTRPGAPSPAPVPEPAEARPAGRGRGSRARGAVEVTRPRGRADREVVGVLTRRPEGFGFVKRISGPPGEDVFLPPPETRFALDGDTVRIELVPGRYGRDAGRLIEVVERRRRHVVGTYRTSGKNAYVQPTDPSLPPIVPVPRFRGAAEGQVVKVALTAYPGPGSVLEGEVVRVVGEPGDPLVEVLAVAYAAGFAEDFPALPLKEAERVPAEVQRAELEGRRDLRELPLVTIDGEDARDFDDAVFVERRGDGYRLVVAIADVSHYVREGTGLDEEALHRATSVYFPNHVLPMLPERLSNGICSLNPHVDRLCMVCDIALDGTGLPTGAELYEGVMRSHARCTYAQVARVLGGEAVPELAAVTPHLQVAGVLAKKLQARRAERGSIDFDLPEAKVVLDEHMVPTAVVKRERNDAHRLVEEFMLAANEAVARHFHARGLPTVYRVHGTPNAEKLEVFATLARAQGFHLDVSEGISPKELNAFLRQLEGSPHQRALNSLLLRAMMQAVYSPENIGHFGLAATHYLHFTSPIRRYPDLMVHRLLKEEWARPRPLAAAERDTLAERLAEVASISSERERASMQAERDIDAYFKCLFVKDRVGERFAATVVAVTDFGFFAELDDTAVEGLVRAEELGTSWDLDPESYRLGFGSGLSFGIGDRVEVEIASVNLVSRRIDLLLVEELERAAPPKKKKGRGRRALEAEAPAFGVISPAEAPVATKRRRPAARVQEAAAEEERAPARKRRARAAPEPERAPRKARGAAELEVEERPAGGRRAAERAVEERPARGRRAEERRPPAAGGGRRKLGAEPTAARLPPRRGAGKAPEAWAGSRSTWRPDEAVSGGGRRTRTGIGAEEFRGRGRGMKRVGTEGFGDWTGWREREVEEPPRRGRKSGAAEPAGRGKRGRAAGTERGAPGASRKAAGKHASSGGTRAGAGGRGGAGGGRGTKAGGRGGTGGGRGAKGAGKATRRRGR